MHCSHAVQISKLHVPDSWAYLAPVDFTVLGDVDIDLAPGTKQSLSKFSLLFEVKPQVQRLFRNGLKSRLDSSGLGRRDQLRNYPACHAGVPERIDASTGLVEAVSVSPKTRRKRIASVLQAKQVFSSVDLQATQVDPWCTLQSPYACANFRSARNKFRIVLLVKRRTITSSLHACALEHHDV